MGRGERTKEIVTFGGAKVVVWPRGDGRWALTWQECGKGRATTIRRKEDALARARKIVREIAGGLGSRRVSVAESEVLQVLYRICGDRPPVALLHELEDALHALKGVPLSRAVSHWRASGMGEVERVTMARAKKRFLDEYESRSVWTRAGVRKEIVAFVNAHSSDLCVCDVTKDELCEWISRKRMDGTKVDPRFFNNRLDTWRTFLNKCRSWNYWPKGEKHPAELIERQREAERMPPIWGVETMRAAMAALPLHLRRYVALGCWAGLRPYEMTRIAPGDFDFERGYIHVRPEVAMKTMQERFVPMEPCLRAVLLEEWPPSFVDPLGREFLLVGEKVCIAKSREYASAALNGAGVIKGWPQDVMRHSYISYRIARGDGIGIVAEHAGNSERIIRRHYRRPLRREDGEAWFAVVTSSAK